MIRLDVPQNQFGSIKMSSLTILVFGTAHSRIPEQNIVIALDNESHVFCICDGLDEGERLSLTPCGFLPKFGSYVPQS